MQGRKIVVLLAFVAGLASSLGLRGQEAVVPGAAAHQEPTRVSIASPTSPRETAPAISLACRDAQPAETPFALPATVINWCCNAISRQCYHSTSGCPTFPAYLSLSACMDRCDP